MRQAKGDTPGTLGRDNDVQLRNKRLVPILVMALLTIVSMRPVLSESRTRPLPGERHLTAADRALALRDMPLRERQELGPLFRDDSNLIVGYTRRIIEFRTRADGSVRPEYVGVHRREGEPLDIPSLEQAAFNETWTPGTSLYQSLTAYRTCSTCLQWNVRHYYDWQGTTGNSNNGNKDRIAISWANGLALKTGSYSMTGVYTNGVNISAIDQYVDANEGVGWSFREWYSPNPPQSHIHANWGRGYASIVEATFQNKMTNVVAGYAHTGFGNSGGSISFGPASISFNGTDDFEWRLSVTVTT